MSTRVENDARPASAAAVHRFLSEVEEVPRGDVGALVVERNGSQEGVVLVEAGRVCWAAAARMPRRLSDLLLERAPDLSWAELQRVFQRCRAEGRPLGESLVEDGRLTVEGLRSALLEHTEDALSLLAGAPGTRKRWFSRDERSYDPRFTFSTVELATGLARRELPEVARRAAETLDELLPRATRGAALYRGGRSSRPIPVAQKNTAELSLAAVDMLSGWAVRTLDISTVFAETVNFVVATLSNGEGWVGWRRDDMVFVAVCHQPRDLAGLLGKLRRQ